MHITLSMLAELLKEQYPSVQFEQPYLSPIKGVTFEPFSEQDMSPNNLYLIKNGTSSPKVIKGMQYLIIGEADDKFDGISYLNLPEGTKEFALINHINALLLKFMNWENALLYSVSRDRSIQALVDLSRDIFENPILVYDTSLRLLEKEPEELLKLGQYWQPTSERVYLGLQSIEMLKETGLMERCKHEKGAFFFYNVSQFLPGLNQEYKCNVLVCGIDIKDTRIGYIHIPMTSKPLSNYHLRLVETLAFCIGQVLKYNIQLSQINSDPTDVFITEICIGKNMSNLYVNHQLKRLGWKRHDPYSVMAIRARDNGKDYLEQTETYCSSLIKIFPDSQISTIDKDIIMVTHNKTFQSANTSEKDETRLILEQNNLHCGCSITFDYFIDIPNYYIQASEAVKLCTTDDRFYPVALYSDHIPEHMSKMFSKKFESVHFIHPAVRLIAKYDFNHQADLLDTLNSYLLNNRSYELCCQELFIHKSTLQYRLDKIRKIAGDESFDSTNKLSILLSILLISYGGIKKQSFRKKKQE